MMEEVDVEVVVEGEEGEVGTPDAVAAVTGAGKAGGTPAGRALGATLKPLDEATAGKVGKPVTEVPAGPGAAGTATDPADGALTGGTTAGNALVGATLKPLDEAGVTGKEGELWTFCAALELGACPKNYIYIYTI